jgi:NodT family efflux transporter outer membrane factor (OMF) lipoprotein
MQGQAERAGTLLAPLAMLTPAALLVWAALLMPAALAGCSLGPFYQRPVLDAPPAFRATADTAEAAWPPEEWWRNFHSPELDGLIASARAYNNDLAAAAARIVQADAQVRISGAPLLPAVDAVASDSYRRTGITGSGGGSGFSIDPVTGGVIPRSGSTRRYFDSRVYTGALQVSYDLDFWGRNRALAQAAQASAVATRFDQATVALNVVTSVANTYFQVLAGQDRLGVAERNLRDAERILGAFRARLTVGTANALDVSQQEALVAGQRAALPNLRNQIEQQRIALGILTGLPPERLLVVGGSLEKLPLPLVAPGLPSELLARRPDVASAEAQLVAENANVRAARAAFFPSVQLTASGGLTSTVLATITGPGTLVAQLAGNLTQTIFDNGLRRGQLNQAKGRYDELLADYRRAVLQSFTDVEQSLAALRYTTEQEKLERQAIAVAQRSADIARAQLQAGTIDIITSLNTQVTLYNDLDLLTQIRLAQFQSLVNVYKALGGGWSQSPSASLGTRP